MDDKHYDKLRDQADKKSQDLLQLKKFKTKYDDLKQDLDPDLTDWRGQPATYQQIRYVYVLAKMLGMTNYEAEMEWDFHHMSKKEINELIEHLQEQAGVEPEDNPEYQPKKEVQVESKNKWMV